VTILDLEREQTIDPTRFHSRGRNTPFSGWRCAGAAWMTIVGGRVVMREGVLEGPAGR
jgi:dihydroorotase